MSNDNVQSNRRVKRLTILISTFDLVNWKIYKLYINNINYAYVAHEFIVINNVILTNAFAHCTL